MLVIVLLSAITILLRVSGFFLMGYVTVTPRIRRMLDALPGCVIVSVVAPAAWQGGSVAVTAVLAAAVAMYFSRSDFVAIVAGAGLAAFLRATGAG